jgi:predicted nucleic acid-binding protein
MPLLYLDTNIIMDFLLDRDSSAFELLSSSLRCRHCIIISDLAINELRYNGIENEAANLIRLLSGNRKLVPAKVLEEDLAEAKKLSFLFSTHYNDILHKAICKRMKADYLVTKNTKDFICFKDIRIRSADDF